MKHQFILTPFFLGKEKPILTSLLEDDWVLNQPVLPSANVNEVHITIREQVSDQMQKGKIPVAINGDCLSTIGVLAGLQKNGIAPIILWLDAHGDFNTFESTISGFLGGMPLAMITGRGDQQFMKGVQAINIPDDDIVLADARELDAAEKVLIEGSGIHWLKGIADIPNFNFGQRPVYIHFDVDIINIDDAPAMLYPTPGGPGKQELASLFQYLSRHLNICAISVTPWEPEQDTSRKTKTTCMELINMLRGG